MRAPALAALAVLLVACAGQPGAGDRSLYAELGGEAGVTRIVDRFLYHLADNERSLHLFANTDIARFRDKFREHLCDIADGPCDYDGDSMARTHRGMDITRAQFNSVVENLIDAMEDAGTPMAAQNDLLARLAAFYPEVSYQ